MSSLMAQLLADKAKADAARHATPATAPAKEPVVTRVPPPTTPSGSEPAKTVLPRRESIRILYPIPEMVAGSTWELVPVVKKSQARIHHAHGYSLVELVRPLKVNAMMKITAIYGEASRSMEVGMELV